MVDREQEPVKSILKLFLLDRQRLPHAHKRLDEDFADDRNDALVPVDFIAKLLHLVKAILATELLEATVVKFRPLLRCRNRYCEESSVERYEGGGTAKSYVGISHVVVTSRRLRM